MGCVRCGPRWPSGVWMTAADPCPEAGHPDAAGWVLGALDADDAERFRQHLASCGRCQEAVAGLGPAARMLHTAAPAAQPPPGLQERTLASVRRAAGAAGPPARAPARHRHRRRIRARWLAAAAAAAAAAVIGVVLVLQGARPAPAGTYTVTLHAAAGGTASGQAVERQTADGWSIQLTVHGLRDLGPGRFYECWYAGPAGRPGHPGLITAGTFTVGGGGSATVQMWTAADPDAFPVMQITAERPGDGGQHGPVILTGTSND